jgi:predicted RecB family nuclease
MDRIDQNLVVSPTDLVGHLACGHLTALDLEALTGDRPKPKRDDPELEVLRRRGLEHETAYRSDLAAEGLDVRDIDEPGGGTGPGSGDDRLAALRRRERETVDAMATGADVVFQATFLDETEPVVWRGHADFLRRVDKASALGSHSYEPEDTKLARQVKPSAVLQLCHYAEQVERIQGVAPDHVHVVLGGRERATIRLREVDAYYRAARSRFLDAVTNERYDTYPLPVGHCAVCRWVETCEQRRADDDHLCRVAGLTREQAHKLEVAGVATLTALAQSPDTLRVGRIADPTLARLRHQARLQAAAEAGKPPLFELLLPVEPDRGLAALPPPDPGDLFYDIEGDPYVGNGGIEYLHGMGSVDAHDEFRFEPLWAHDARGERRAFETLIDRIVVRRRHHPDMHVYHYAPYEPAALGRLMGRYGTREDELDDLLRGGVFVDLYRVVRQGLVIGSPSYSLKKLEPLYMQARTGEITDAGSSIVQYEQWLQTGDQAILDEIEAYNRDDVESTWRLRDWLEARRADAVGDGHTIERPAVRETEAAEEDGRSESDAAQIEEESLMGHLLDGWEAVSDDEDVVEDDGVEGEARARWLMAQLLQWHKREAKPEWWRYFERVLSYDDDDLFADTEAIAGLRVIGDPETESRSFVWTYAFDPAQEHKLPKGKPVLDPAVERDNYFGSKRPGPGSLVAVDPVAGTLKLKRGKTSKAEHPSALIPPKPIKTAEQRASLRRVASALLEAGIDGPGPAAAARQLLGRRPPRLRPSPVEGADLRREDEPAIDAAVRLARDLDRSCLAIQGPPGSGKTYTAAHVILALIDDGRTVGITANSHEVISNLLRCVLEESVAGKVEVRALQKVAGGADGVTHDAVLVTDDNAEVEAAVGDGSANLIAGTGWLFARPGMTQGLDTLVVDEAGQLSLANVMAVAPAASNLILVGDPRQLAQPSKGTHPDGAGVSALDHVLDGATTMPSPMGLFLDRTWRLHPDICTFISEQVYDGRLEAVAHCSNQRVADGALLGGTGLRWLPVCHEGNRTSSVEEADAVGEVYRALLGREWTDHDGEQHTIGRDEILVVAPYNAQVRQLADSLPRKARVGTVDKFQGQEAPVVIVSLAASSAEDVPRGMEFLYSRNRLNVAVSRAKALCVMVGSPSLLDVRCRTVEQMRLANVLCRYVEMATTIDTRSSP